MLSTTKPDDLIFFAFFAFLILMIILAIYSEIKRKKEKENRKKSLSQYAKKNNYKFIDEYRKHQYLFDSLFFGGANKSKENVELIDNFEVLDKGDIENVLIKDEEKFKVCSGEHTYTTGSGKNRTTHYCFFVVIECDEIQIPAFFARDESAIFDYLGKLFGGQDINFTNDNVFSPNFVLQGKSETEIRKFFTPKIRKAFATFVLKQGYYIYGYNNSILIYKEKIPTMDNILEAERKIKGIFNAIYSEHVENNELA